MKRMVFALAILVVSAPQTQAAVYGTACGARATVDDVFYDGAKLYDGEFGCVLAARGPNTFVGKCVGEESTWTEKFTITKEGNKVTVVRNANVTFSLTRCGE